MRGYCKLDLSTASLSAVFTDPPEYLIKLFNKVVLLLAHCRKDNVYFIMNASVSKVTLNKTCIQHINI